MKKKDQPNLDINLEALLPKKTSSKVILSYKTKNVWKNIIINFN
jgi:hypothetical protein